MAIENDNGATLTALNISSFLKEISSDLLTEKEVEFGVTQEELNKQIEEEKEKARLEEEKSRGLEEAEKIKKLAENKQALLLVFTDFIKNANSFIAAFEQQKLHVQAKHIQKHADEVINYASNKKKYPNFYTKADADITTELTTKIAAARSKANEWVAQFKDLKQQLGTIHVALHNNKQIEPSEVESYSKQLKEIHTNIEDKREDLSQADLKLQGTEYAIEALSNIPATTHAQFAKNKIQVKSGDATASIKTTTGAELIQNKDSTVLKYDQIKEQSPAQKITTYFEMFYSEFIRYGIKAKIPVKVYSAQAACALIAAAKAFGIPAANLQLTYLKKGDDPNAFVTLSTEAIQAWYNSMSLHSTASPDIGDLFKDASGNIKYATTRDVYEATKKLHDLYKMQYDTAGVEHENLRGLNAGFKDVRKKHIKKDEQALSVASRELFFHDTAGNNKDISGLAEEGKALAEKITVLGR